MWEVYTAEVLKAMRMLRTSHQKDDWLPGHSRPRLASISTQPGAPRMIGHVYLKRYKVLRPLDEGGMSKVYLGMQLDPPREAAIKVVRAELAAQPRVRAQFRREAYILSKFHHPHSVTFYDTDVEGKQPVLVMEYLRGLDLLHLLQRNKRLSPERTGRLLGQMCAVLQAAHEQGIVHRDVKPANFMIVHPDTPYEQVKLMDFGLATM